MCIVCFCWCVMKEQVEILIWSKNMSITLILKQLLKLTASGTRQTASKHFFSCSSASRKTFSHATSAQSLFNYTHAITRGVPKSFAQFSLRLDPSQQIVLSRAIEQMRKYVDVLKKCGLEVMTIPAEEHYPDCIFVEDAALVIGQKACLSRPGHTHRRGEVIVLGGDLYLCLAPFLWSGWSMFSATHCRLLSVFLYWFPVSVIYTVLNCLSMIMNLYFSPSSSLSLVPIFTWFMFLTWTNQACPIHFILFLC